MPVNLKAPDPGELLPITGVRSGAVAAGIRKPGRRDLLVIELEPGARVAGVFTRNRFCAAPVLLAKKHLAARRGIRALVVNTGNANAGTGAEGLLRARQVCKALADQLGCSPTQILPFSTGVIMEPLPHARVIAGLPAAIAALAPDAWARAAESIMTTDTVPKAASARVRLSGGVATVTGIAKGAGMIHPDMATMLGFVATDADLGARELASITRRSADASFNCITVDGDTSTNDSYIVISSGRGPAARSPRDLKGLESAITGVARQLAQAIIRDGEGASKFVTITVDGGRSVAECRRAAYAIAHSPLVKTAFFASDPNLGRILAAIGHCGIPGLDTASIGLRLDDVIVVRRGGRASDYDEARALAVMRKPEFTVQATLGRGRASATVWTCDFSFDYVKINAEYRT